MCSTWLLLMFPSLNQKYSETNLFGILIACLLIIGFIFFIPSVRTALNIQPLTAADWLVVLASSFSLLVIQLLKRTNIIHDED